jgi:hypothetical protein
MKKSVRRRLTVWARWSLFWTLLIGVGAGVGTAMMWSAPDLFGMTPLLGYMQDLMLADVFFTGFFFPGLFLLLVNGATQLFAALLIIRRSRMAPVTVICCGLILIGWILIQFLVFPTNPLSITFFVFGLLETLMAVVWMQKRRA